MAGFFGSIWQQEIALRDAGYRVDADLTFLEELRAKGGGARGGITPGRQPTMEDLLQVRMDALDSALEELTDVVEILLAKLHKDKDPVWIRRILRIRGISRTHFYTKSTTP
jgi:hypothetical protein